MSWERRQYWSQVGGSLTCLLAALVIVWVNYDMLQTGKWYSRSLMAAPGLFMAGLGALLAAHLPQGTFDFIDDHRTLLGGIFVVLFLLVGFGFEKWFLGLLGLAPSWNAP